MKLITDKTEAVRLFTNRRQSQDDPELLRSVAETLAEVRARGDEAVLELSKRFGGADLDYIQVPEAALEKAEAEVSPELKSAIELASSRVHDFYSAQPKGGFLEQKDGALLGQLVRPLERVACYVPAGQAPLFSTLIMTAVPAKVAGVPEVVVASPPNASGEVAPEVLVAARVCGVNKVYALGGPVAVAALAHGTESVERVDKIVGPGSRYTMAAKQLVFGEVGIEALPGPTETLVLADDSADTNHVVADLLAQAEHDQAQPVLVTTSRALVDAVTEALEPQLKSLPTEQTARESVEQRGVIVLVETLDDALEVANAYAPEHLCLLLADPWRVVPQVKHAGGLFIGEHSMEALGDYIIGPSHVMPTGGTARYSSAVNLRDFQKVIPLVSLSQATVAEIGPAAAIMARAEGLEAHARAVESRLPQD